MIFFNQLKVPTINSGKSPTKSDMTILAHGMAIAVYFGFKQQQNKQDKTRGPSLEFIETGLKTVIYLYPFQCRMSRFSVFSLIKIAGIVSLRKKKYLLGLLFCFCFVLIMV